MLLRSLAPRGASGSIFRGPEEDRLIVAIHQSLRLLARQARQGLPRDPFPFVAPEEERVRVGDQQLAVLRWPRPGAPVLVLLHGLNSNAWAWARIAVLLREGREVMSVSLRGHGSSTAPARGYRLEDTTADLLSLLRQKVGEEPVDLAGHSWGGKVATHLAVTEPRRVRTLILADPVMPQGLNLALRGLPRLMMGAFRGERGPFPNREACVAASRELGYLYRQDEYDQRYWFDTFHPQPDGQYVNALPEEAMLEIFRHALMADLRPWLGRLLCPTLLLVPRMTVSFLPGELQPYLGLPRVQLKRVGLEHNLIQAQPEETAEAMATFLDGLSPRAFEV